MLHTIIRSAANVKSVNLKLHHTKFEEASLMSVALTGLVSRALPIQEKQAANSYSQI